MKKSRILGKKATEMDMKKRHMWLRSLLLRLLNEVSTPYKIKAPILSAEEITLYYALQKSVKPGHMVMMQVPLQDLVKVKYMRSLPERKSAKRQINNRYIDFLVCDAQGNYEHAIDLDRPRRDRSGRGPRDRFYAALFKAIGVRLHKVKAQHSYSTEQLGHLLYPEDYYPRPQPEATFTMVDGPTQKPKILV